MADIHDTEDKRWWCQHGQELEKEFVKICNEKLGLKACINPEKENNPYAPDLIVNGQLADLKVQNTPFFKAKELFGVEPAYAVTFNRNDYNRYRAEYPDIDIYFWVEWKTLEKKIGGRTYKVDGLCGIYTLPFKRVKKLIEAGAQEHGYQRRVFDQMGNARSSFVLDIRKFNKLFEVKPPSSRGPGGSAPA